MMKPFLSGHLGIRGAHIIRYVDMLYTLVVTLFGGPYSSEQVGVIIANISHHQNGSRQATKSLKVHSTCSIVQSVAWLHIVGVQINILGVSFLLTWMLAESFLLDVKNL